MKNWLIGAVIVAVAATLTPSLADAKRLGGGKSSGMQRDMPARSAPDAPAGKAPAAPTQAPGQQAAGAAAAPGAAAAAGKRSWMGPIAGLAAGLGLAALMSHLGMGEAFANFLMLALLAVAVIALVVFIRRRMNGGAAREPALAGAGAGAGMERSAMPSQVAWPSGSGSGSASAPPQALAPAAAAAPEVSAAFVPAAFDSEGFERIAKAIFIRMQTANDTANLNDLRQFTTPEMFASLKLDLLDRDSAAQTTDVKRVDAKVIDVAEDAVQHVVSVRYRGEVIEATGQAPVAFDEIWHLVKPRASEGAWLISGIEQMS